MELIKVLIEYAVVPSFLWVWITDRKLVKIESQQITKDDLKELYDLVRGLSNKIENTYISKSSCDFRHNLKD